jgi:hypothetical protein
MPPCQVLASPAAEPAQRCLRVHLTGRKLDGEVRHLDSQLIAAAKEDTGSPGIVVGNLVGGRTEPVTGQFEDIGAVPDALELSGDYRLVARTMHWFSPSL